FFFFQAEDGIRDLTVTGVQTCALPICRRVSGGALPADCVERQGVLSDLREMHRARCRVLLNRRSSRPAAAVRAARGRAHRRSVLDRKSTRLNSSHSQISYAVFCLKKKK